MGDGSDYIDVRLERALRFSEHARAGSARDLPRGLSLALDVLMAEDDE